MIRSNSWLWRAIPPTPAPTPPSLTSGNFYSCHLLSQMTQLSFQLPSQLPAPSPSLASRLSPIFSVSCRNPNLREAEIFPAARPTSTLNLNQVANPATISAASLSLAAKSRHQNNLKLKAKSGFTNQIFCQFQLPHTVSPSFLCSFRLVLYLSNHFTDIHFELLLLCITDLFCFSVFQEHHPRSSSCKRNHPIILTRPKARVQPSTAPWSLSKA